MLKYSRSLNGLLTRVNSLVGFVFALTLLITAVFSYTRMSTYSPVYAATSSNLNYQAKLLTATGSVVPDGYYNVEFKLYSASSGGSSLWDESYYDANGPALGQDNRVRVVGGYMYVNLGSQTAFPALNWDQDMWLTMNVGGAAQTATPTYDGEMNPRIKLTAVPYAFQAKQSEKLSKTTGANTGVLDFLALTANRNINLPDKDGTLCIAGDMDCVDVATTNTTATTSSNSGLEVSADGLRLLGGCTDGQMLRWNDTTKKWECSSGSGLTFTARASDGSVSTSVSGALEFGPASSSSDEFIVSNQGGGVTRIRLGNTVLTTTNYTTTLDSAYVNAAESPAAGEISGSFAAGFTLAEAVDFSTSVTSPIFTSNGALTLNSSATAGADDLIFQAAGTEKLRLLENGDLKFEKGTNDVTFTVDTPGSAAVYTFTGATGTVLTSANAGLTLDSAYVNEAQSPAAGDITGSFSAGLTIGTNSVALGTDTVGDYIATLGTATGLTLSGNTGEGSTPGISVNYGSAANTAVQGNVQLTCASGTGNLTGGGTAITLGSGGTCAAISTNSAVSFSTSVTTPTLTNTAGITIDAVSASNTVVGIGNSGSGFADLNLSDGGLQVAGTGVLNNSRVLSNLTGITTSGTVTFTSLTSGGLVKSAAGTGALSLAVAGTDYENPLTFGNGLTRTTNAVALGGNLSSATTIGLNSNSLKISGTGTAAANFAAGGGLEILADTNAALAVRNSAGTVTYFGVNASGNIVQIGSATANANPILFVLNSYNQAADPTGVAGASYYSTTEKRMRCFEDNIWKNCISDTVQGKTADQTVTNSATFTNATDLAFPMDTNSTYTFNAVINFSSSSNVADFKYTFIIPVGATIYATAQAPTNATAITNCSIVASAQTCTVLVGSGYRSSMTVSGYVTTAGTAGNLQFQYAQNTQTAGQSATIYKGSSISWRRTAP